MGLELAIAGAAIASTAAAVGTTFGVVGAVQNHAQQRANAESQQEMMEYNARQEKREAAAVEAETLEAARRQRAEDERLRSMQRAMYGASGLAMTSGSPLAVLGAAAATQELAVQDIHRVGGAEYGRRLARAAGFQLEGQMARKSVPGAATLAAGIGGAVAGGAGSLGSSLMAVSKYKSE